MTLNFRFQRLGLFGRKMGVAATPAPKGLKTRPKSWPALGSFWVNCYLKIVFPNFRTLDLNRHWLDILILRFLSLAVQLLEFQVKSLKDLGEPGLVERRIGRGLVWWSPGLAGVWLK